MPSINTILIASKICSHLCRGNYFSYYPKIPIINLFHNIKLTIDAYTDFYAITWQTSSLKNDIFPQNFFFRQIEEPVQTIFYIY